MTVHYFNAYFVRADQTEFYGTILWDKNEPRKLKAELYPKEGENLYGYAVWSSSIGTEAECATQRLVEKLKQKAKAMNLEISSERFTEFAPDSRN